MARDKTFLVILPSGSRCLNGIMNRDFMSLGLFPQNGRSNSRGLELMDLKALATSLIPVTAASLGKTSNLGGRTAQPASKSIATTRATLEVGEFNAETVLKP